MNIDKRIFVVNIKGLLSFNYIIIKKGISLKFYRIEKYLNTHN